MKITLLDIITGKRRAFEQEFDEYQVTEGNWSCDCNREIMMLDVDERHESGCCLGCHRFLVVAVTGSNLPLEQFNTGYPKDLVFQHLH